MISDCQIHLVAENEKFDLIINDISGSPSNK